MNASSGKRAPIPRRGSGLQLRDGSIFCNRLGCHGRLNHSRAPITEQTCRRVHCSSGKAIVGSSNRPSSTKITLRKATSEGNPSSYLVSSRNIRMVDSSRATSSGQTRKIVHSSIVGSSTRTSSTKVTLRKATFEGSPSSSQVEPDMSELSSAETVQAGFQSQSDSNPSRKVRIGEVLGSSSATSSSRPLKVSKQRSEQTSKSSSSCRDTSDNITRINCLRSASTSYTNLNRNKDVSQKQNPSAIESKIPLRGKQISRPNMVAGHGSVRVPSNGISISDSRHRPWSSSNSNNRASTIPLRTPVPRPSSRSNYSCTSRPILGGSYSTTDWSTSSVGGEQSLGMEGQVFQGGTAVYDQFRDMRLDIDNMSYEDLLALGERIGNVSIGIEEEDMWKYLSRRIYDHTSSSLENHTDIQCSICQEEFVNGDEVGSLSCNHSYHLTCIDQWLRRTKWCPNCKVEAAPIDISSSSR